jgi:hypothetical protein
MRLPQSIFRYFSARTVNPLTIGIVIALVGMVPGRANAAPRLSCSPTILRFATVVVGQSETLMVTVTNNEETSVTISGFAISNSAFTASNPTFVLGVEGTGVSSQSLSSSPSIVSFGQVAMGTSSTIPVVLSNTRSQKTTLSTFQTMGNGFLISGPTLPLTLGAGQSVTVNVTFTPPAAATQGGNLYVSGPGLVIPLTGTGTSPQPQYSVNLFWNSASDVAGYNVYRSTAANGTYAKINPTLNSNTAFTDSSVVSGQTYYYAATSVSSGGMESTRSTPPVPVAIP